MSPGLNVASLFATPVVTLDVADAGANETIRPKSTRLVMFRAWLLRLMRPYIGTAERLSIAFNLGL